MLFLFAPAWADCPAQRVAREVMPALVRVDFELWRQGPDPEDVPPPIREAIGDLSRLGGAHRQGGHATGFVIRRDGLLLTAAHAVSGPLVSIRATFADGRVEELRLVGIDPWTDTAVLALPEGRWPSLSLGRSEPLVVGAQTVVMGWPLEAQPTVASGVISAVHVRTGSGRLDDWLQTDAAFNFGTSGGPLLSCARWPGRVRVVGLASFVRRGENLGFAVPIDRITSRLDELVASGTVARATVPVALQGLDPELARALGLPRVRGALVAEPWSEGVLEAGDVVSSFEGKPIRDPASLLALAADRQPGERVMLRVWREGAEIELELVLVSRRDGSPAEVAIPPAPARLGLVLGEVSEEWGARTGLRGVRVEEVDGAGASHGRLRRGDVLLSMGGEALVSVESAEEGLEEAVDVALFRVWRKGEQLWVAVPTGIEAPERAE